MSVKAKFKVDKVERILSSVPVTGEDGKTEWVRGEVQSIHMSPVYGNGDPNHENTRFWHASPSGSFVLGCANLAAAQYFELGKEYIFDISLAE
jgi:hypothetical protein